MTKSIFSIFALVLFGTFTKPVYGNEREAIIKHGKILKISNFLNVHSSPKYWLRIEGKRFNDVSGFDPFYVPIDDIKAVFFVTSPWNEKKVAHIFFLREKRDIEFPIYYEGFDCSTLGQPVSAKGAVIIETVAPPIVVIRCKRDLISDWFEFNVETRKCSRIKN